MAQAVGATAEDLTRAGRQDAADALEEITPEPAEPAGAYAPPVDAVYEIMAALPPEAQEEVIRRLAREKPAAARLPERHERHAG
ncbi:hypothetical protein ACH437_23860 [Streptomyces xinghaiensis]|uniref:hypothetical protein n=1 Tax=Streptomyces xinghaiensis TaxID=1038928 RepID=UPI00378AFF75